MGKGDTVILLDDVATTGNSITACRDILMSFRAREVEMIVLGMTCCTDQVKQERACVG